MPKTQDLTRRELLFWGVAGGLSSIALGNQRTLSSPAPKPNVVFILADDLGYADLSSYGRPDIRTPHIDRIAKDGARLTQAYANSAVCTATRTALITGRYQYRLRVGLEEPLVGNLGVGLPPEQPTLSSLLKKGGYGTTLIGKWHLGVLPTFGPLQSGYEHFYGFRGGALDYFSHKSPNGVDDLWDDNTQIHQTGYMTQLLGERATAVIDGYAKSRQPFLLSLHFNSPHWPWEGPGDQRESDRLLAKPASDLPSLFDFDGGTQKTYRQMVEAMDQAVGRVLAALDSSGLAKNTIVIFTSDNGGERFSDNWPFTGRKTELLEGGLRVPALIRWTGHIPPSTTCEQVTMSMDWMPTLLAAADIAPDSASALDGINLLPVLEARAPDIRRTLFWRYKANAQRAVRDGDFKFLKIRDNTFLFNVVEDPLERANLKDRYPEIYKKLITEWHQWNATMMPEIGESYTDGFTAKQLADHIGAQPVTAKPDLGDDD